MQIVKIEENTNNIIKKHNELVKTARYRLSELSIKVVSCLIAMIQSDDVGMQDYYLNVKDFKEMIGSNSDDIYRQIDKLTDELMKNPFKIGDEKFNWVRYAKYKKGEGTFILRIAPELMPFLLELKENFLQYSIKDILLLKSRYVIRLYELMIAEYNQQKRYKPNQKKYTLELEINYLKELFEIPSSYLYKDIRIHIIDKAKKEFLEKTNISFEYQEIKQGRKVHKLLINIKENQKGSNDILKDRKSFIGHIRSVYKPVPEDNIFPTILTTNQGDLKIDKEGNIYNSSTTRNYTAEEANRLWDWLFGLVKEKGIEVLTNPAQKSLF